MRFPTHAYTQKAKFYFCVPNIASCAFKTDQAMPQSLHVYHWWCAHLSWVNKKIIHTNICTYIYMPSLCHFCHIWMCVMCFMRVCTNKLEGWSVHYHSALSNFIDCLLASVLGGCTLAWWVTNINSFGAYLESNTDNIQWIILLRNSQYYVYIIYDCNLLNINII